MFGKKSKPKTDAAPQKTGFRIGSRIKNLLKSSPDEFYDDLEDLLVESDFGAVFAVEVVDELRGRAKNRDKDSLTEELKNIIRPSLQNIDLTPDPEVMTLYLVLGVNGVGKTTTIAKMARLLKPDKGIVLAAGDTFRAAAIEQLEIHAQRTGARLVRQDHGSDPGAVIHDAVTSAWNKGERLVIADTAGRMHNRTNLVQELSKIDRIARDRIGSDGVYKKILVIDATTGQNGLRQAETFQESVGIDAVIMTKYDSSAKGGLAAAVCRKLNLPFAYLGMGEGMDDLRPFDPESYLDELLAD